MSSRSSALALHGRRCYGARMTKELTALGSGIQYERLSAAMRSSHIDSHSGDVHEIEIWNGESYRDVFQLLAGALCLTFIAVRRLAQLQRKRKVHLSTSCDALAQSHDSSGICIDACSDSCPESFSIRMQCDVSIR